MFWGYFFSPAPGSESGTTEQFCVPAPDLELGGETYFIKLVLAVIKLSILMKEGR